MLKIKEISVPGYKKVIEGTDPKTNLHCYIAIHDSTLGPALGGTRMYPYKKPEDALNDVLRLAKGMTYKSAVAEDGLGGGKSVIIGNPATDKNEKLLLSFGQVINSLKGEYIAAEDVGTSPEDMVIIRRETPYVAALPTEKSSGDPSHFTAWGVFRGLQAISQKLWKTSSLAHRSVLIQGLGHVGSKLAYLLFWEGADLIFSDIDSTILHKNALRFGAKTVTADQVYTMPCDIFSPCAMGGILNEKTVPLLNCKSIGGSANNQLSNSEQGWKLMERGILYAPDYIINSGGVINAAAEFEPGGYDPKTSRDHVGYLYKRLIKIFEMSEKANKPPCNIADELAEYNLKHGIGKRKIPIKFSP